MVNKKIKYGTQVHFKWLGGTFAGEVQEINPRLTEDNKEYTYWIKELSEGSRYPVKLSEIIKYL
jgi:hypothetical protein